MLCSIYLKNYTLVDELAIEFGEGLSIITGETGAGKSVIVGALNLLVGERASPDLVRAGAQKAIVEAEFDIAGQKNVTAFLKVNEIEARATLLVRREIGAQGTSRAFVNDSPVTLGILKNLGALLVDLHGQHDHQSLLHPEEHRNFLDGYAGIDRDIEAYKTLYGQYLRLRNEITKLEALKADWARERDFLLFQFNEIVSVAPEAGEDERIESELNVREHAEELIAATEELHDLLYDAEDSVYAKLSHAKAVFERIAKLDPAFNESLAEINAALVSSRETGAMLSRYGDRVEYDPERLNALRERQLALSRLKKKYGPELSGVIATFESLKEKLAPENDIDEQIAARESELGVLRNEMSERAAKLTQVRRQAAKKFEKAIKAALVELGMERAQFEINFACEEIQNGDAKVYVETDRKKFFSYSWGIDKIEFFISTNKGESPKPLARIASGGEISRVMLALKSMLSHADKIPTLVFDEIDTGISGRIAQKAGKVMKLLGKEHQVIAITHLGQIAAFADRHYIVEKKTTKSSTTASLRLLGDAEHQSEIARLIAGETVSPESLEAARALKQEANELAAR